jgi:hypothetical protein
MVSHLNTEDMEHFVRVTVDKVGDQVRKNT